TPMPAKENKNCWALRGRRRALFTASRDARSAADRSARDVYFGTVHVHHPKIPDPPLAVRIFAEREIHRSQMRGILRPRSELAAGLGAAPASELALVRAEAHIDIPKDNASRLTSRQELARCCQNSVAIGEAICAKAG